MKNETIVDRVVERLKAQPLGDLITEEDLHDIVRDAIPKAFFERRKITVRDGYRSEEREVEPAIVEVLRDLLKDSAKAAVEAWMVENAETIADHWRTVIDDGLLKYVQHLQDERATSQIKAVLFELIKPLNEARSRQGLPYINL